MGCVGCGKNESGGVYTNFDPFGTRRKLGLSVESYQHICWECWPAVRSKDRRIQHATTQAVRDRGLCGFIEAWAGHCMNKAPCDHHKDQKCWKCGDPADRNCAEAGLFVCGFPECAQHPHEHHRNRII